MINQKIFKLSIFASTLMIFAFTNSVIATNSEIGDGPKNVTLSCSATEAETSTSPNFIVISIVEL